MKTRNITLMLLVILTVTGCRAPMNVDEEKLAIIDVINAETEAYMDGDFEKVISFYVQDSLNFRLTTGADDHVFLQGWKEVEEFFENDLLEGEAETSGDAHVSVIKDDYRIKVYERSAYVICKEKWTYSSPDNVIEIESLQVRFMEKVEDSWKIAFLSFIGTSGYDTETEADIMELEEEVFTD